MHNSEEKTAPVAVDDGSLLIESLDLEAQGVARRADARGASRD